EDGPSEEALYKEMKKLESDIRVESIKAEGRAKLPCFAVGTPVLTPQGSKPIESLMPGDEVWAWNFTQECAVARRVAQIHRGRAPRWVDIRNGRAGVRATTAHRFFSQSCQAWLDAESLRPGMRLLTLDASDDALQSTQTSEISWDEETFNLSIDE